MGKRRTRGSAARQHFKTSPGEKSFVRFATQLIPTKLLLCYKYKLICPKAKIWHEKKNIDSVLLCSAETE
jgi:hypothetical protein